MQNMLFVLFAALICAIGSALASPLYISTPEAPQTGPVMPPCAARCLLPALSIADCDPRAATCFCSSDAIPAKIGNCILDRCADAQDISSALLSLPDCRTAGLPEKPTTSWLSPGVLDLEGTKVHGAQMVMSAGRL
ncbi:hypothetical protein HDZ31DRAFT_65082 [Schizophyllum fasciatum]